MIFSIKNLCFISDSMSNGWISKKILSEISRHGVWNLNVVSIENWEEFAILEDYPPIRNGVVYRAKTSLCVRYVKISNHFVAAPFSNGAQKLKKFWKCWLYFEDLYRF